MNFGIIKSFNINNLEFKCRFVGFRGEICVYKTIGLLNATHYIAKKDNILVYSRNKEKAIKNVRYMEEFKLFESKPLDMNQNMDIETFIFMYKAETNACQDFKYNLLNDIRKRNIQPQSEYSLQQLICFSINRYNFEYFITYIY